MTTDIETQRRLSIPQILAISYTVLLTYVLLVPDPLWFIPETGDAVDEVVETTFLQYVQHLAAYTVLTAILGWGFAVNDRPVARFAVWPAVAHGILTEWLQQFIPERYPAWTDVVFNFAGITLGWMAIVILMKSRMHGQSPIAGAAPRR